MSAVSTKSDLMVRESYRRCIRLARRTGRNFYYSFWTLPRPLYESMCALYAFMRITDDIADDPSIAPDLRAAALDQWQGQVHGALQSPFAAGGGHACLPAIVATVRRHGIPHEYLETVIDGVREDLSFSGFDTFDELAEYCYKVAGVVGLSCIYIWGFHGEEAKDLAVQTGLAFQLTNILRDLREDAEMGRLYLPREDLQRAGYTEDELRAGLRNEAYGVLMKRQVARARGLYAASQPLVHHVHAQGQPILLAMRGIYGALLDKIARRDYDVFSDRIRLSALQKTRIVLSAMYRFP